MSDLPYINQAQEVKITGQDSTGNTVNFVSADSSGNLLVKNASSGSVTPGTVASFSSLSGGQFNTSLPTLTNTQQSAIQLDSSGRQIVAPLTNSSIVKVQLQDNSGTAITLGQKTMASSLPVVLASDQSTVLIAGNVASGSADSGNPVKIGGVYNTTLPVVTSGSRVDLQLDANGRLLTSSVSLPTTASKFSFGQLATNTSVNYLAIEFTAYTEPTTNSAMTIVSSNANDSSAGTGARTVTVTYLDQTGAGPFTTTFTMNGTSVVTAGVSNMCFIEKIVVATVGSTGSNVGIITLKTGGGATVGTIAATNNQTFWAHHYVPTGLICYISGFSFGNNATAAGNGAQFILKASTPTIANTPEIQISDFLSQAGVSSTDTRIYNSPIQVSGPARIRAYVLPFANAATTQFASFDFIDN